MRGKLIAASVLSALASAGAHLAECIDVPPSGATDRSWLNELRRPSFSPRGKRYSASVRQHQRHASKARNKAKSR